MALRLAREEPEGGPWRAEPLTVVIEALTRLGSGRAIGGRGVVLAVDGRSSSGKTRLAARMNSAVADSVVVHTDDIAWWHSRFGWADLLVDDVLVPFRHGEQVSCRPPRWAEHGRQGWPGLLRSDWIQHPKSPSRRRYPRSGRGSADAWPIGAGRPVLTAGDLVRG